MYKIINYNVIDGDTVDVDIVLGFDIVLKNKRIRLNGIDAPESRTSDIDEKEFGLFVKSKVIEFLGAKLNLKLKVTNEKDKFGRILGDIINSDTNKSLCSYLLDNNLVVEYHGENKDSIKEKHKINKKIHFSD